MVGDFEFFEGNFGVLVSWEKDDILVVVVYCGG